MFTAFLPQSNEEIGLAKTNVTFIANGLVAVVHLLIINSTESFRNQIWEVQVIDETISDDFFFFLIASVGFAAHICYTKKNPE